MQAGSLLALEESGLATYHTGEQYHFRVAFRRMCSWVITKTEAIAATKGHIDYLRGVCLSPPEPPYTISIAVSGQKHVLYRAAVCYSRDVITVTLEGEAITYTPV